VSRAPSFICGALLLVICPMAARAAGASARRVELVVVAGPAEGVQPFEAALREVLVAKRLGLASARKDTLTPEEVALATTASPEEAASIVARVFVDFTAAGHATLFLIDPRRGRIHVRRVTMAHGFDVVERARCSSSKSRSTRSSKVERSASVAKNTSAASSLPHPRRRLRARRVLRHSRQRTRPG
jgi:hypothetical protein